MCIRDRSRTNVRWGPFWPFLVSSGGTATRAVRSEGASDPQRNTASDNRLRFLIPVPFLREITNKYGNRADGLNAYPMSRVVGSTKITMFKPMVSSGLSACTQRVTESGSDV